MRDWFKAIAASLLYIIKRKRTPPKRLKYCPALYYQVVSEDRIGAEVNSLKEAVYYLRSASDYVIAVQSGERRALTPEEDTEVGRLKDANRRPWSWH